MAELNYRETDEQGHTRRIECSEDRHIETPLPNNLRELLNALCTTPERKEKNTADMELSINGRVHRWNADTTALRMLHTALHRELYSLIPALHGCRAAAPSEDDQ